ncbi:MAG TPA: hypothetical protein VN703_05265 [Candidatus Sulfopaludibacter sp.]|nr:hypothetical protein [Candidatus Sulfopaludibacter sp.]
METITPTQFFNIWNGNYKEDDVYKKYYVNLIGQDEVVFADCNIAIGSIEFNFSQLPPLRLYRCNIKSLIIGQFITKNIVLNECIVENLFLEEFECQDLNIERGSFSNISINKDNKISISKQNIIGTLKISRVSLFKVLSIDHALVNQLSIENDANITDVYVSSSTINNMIFNRESNCVGISITKDSSVAKIDNDNFSQIGSLITDSSRLGNISLSNSSSIKSVRIDNKSLTQGFTIESKSSIGFFGVYKESQTGFLNVRGNSSIECVFIENSKTGSISFYQSTVTYINENECSHIFGITLEYLTVASKQLIISKSIVETLILALDNPYQIKTNGDSQIFILNLESVVFSKDTIVQISDTRLNELKLNSFLNQGVVVFSNIMSLTSYEKIKVNNGIPQVDANGYYLLDTISKKSTLKFINSDLGRMQFIGCDLRDFDEFVFLNSKMLEVFVADTTFPNKNQIQSDFKLSSNHKLNKRNLLNQQRLALSQFKKVYEGQGDIVKATEYHASELDAYRDLLKEVEPNNFKEWCNKSGELINLWLNKHSSYYGNNWLRAVAWTLMLNTILFTCYCWALGFRLGTNSSVFWQLSSYSLEFLNPLRKADFLSSIARPTNGGRIIDYISRIIIAYFVYQTIQAFRKYGKKS